MAENRWYEEIIRQCRPMYYEQLYFTNRQKNKHRKAENYTRRHVVDCIARPRHIEVGTVSLPVSSRSYP